MPAVGSPHGPNEQAWLAAYDPRAFAPIAVTVDVVALTIRHRADTGVKALHVLTIRRGGMPFAGHLALPGGFVRAAEDEDLDEAAVRELAEETGLAAHGGGEAGHLHQPGGSGSDADASNGHATAARPPIPRLHLEQLGTYGAPGRD
ncbi:MAG: NUDIX domain-containing protein, partial [Streptomycetaceae bacterium]|nr:NUDIX domain-containing protein [Streptomycetaceae bacterium]